MREITFSDRLRYQFDNTMSKGPIALIGYLALLSLVLIMGMALLMKLFGFQPEGENVGFFRLAWMGLMRTLDAGTMGGDTGSPGLLFSWLFVTLGGIFIVSTLIGVLTSGIEGKLDELRKGRSLIIEKNHTVILGWSSQIFSIISELMIANANQKDACIAVLADKDKVEMEDEIRSRIGSNGRTRIVCRSGSPLDLSDLEIINPHNARSVIILPPEGEDPDSHVIKTILALVNNPNRRREPYHIVAEIRDTKNMEVAEMVSKGEAQLLQVSELISRITVQVCRQSGLSVVYTELLDFGGDEIYFHEEPGLAGKSFGEALLAYEDSAVIGLRMADGRVLLNPPMETRLAAGDKIIAVSQDDDTIRLAPQGAQGIDEANIRAPHKVQEVPERTLILGWNRRGPSIINELNQYVASGSAVTVVTDEAEAETEIVRQCAGLENLNITFHLGDTTDRRTLDALDVPAFQHVIILSYSDRLGQQEADARSLITLLHLRRIGEAAAYPFSIISEMLDIRNRDLAGVTRADDFIVSDKLVSLMLSQVSENKELTAVFADLFDPEGSELYLKPAGNYVQLDRPVNFYTVVEAARRRGEVAIGYRLHNQAENPAESYGVRVNPKKSENVTFTNGDTIIVLAEE
jgi:voltage-gated potassium channel Kch